MRMICIYIDEYKNITETYSAACLLSQNPEEEKHIDLSGVC